MNETNTEEQPSLTDILTSGPAAAGLAQNECPQCHKVFSNAMGLRMHTMRVHTGQLGTGYRWKGTNSEEAHKARRRAYQKKLRERYKLQGKNSRGYPVKTGAHKWGPEQLKKFQATMRKKARKKTLQPSRDKLAMQSRRIQIVYPEPGDITPDITKPRNPYAVTYCPCCGLHLKPVEAALAQSIQ